MENLCLLDTSTLLDLMAELFQEVLLQTASPFLKMQLSLLELTVEFSLQESNLTDNLFLLALLPTDPNCQLEPSILLALTEKPCLPAELPTEILLARQRTIQSMMKENHCLLAQDLMANHLPLESSQMVLSFPLELITPSVLMATFFHEV
jgi:hypothetical protein